jgi:hypothetical protein
MRLSLALLLSLSLLLAGCAPSILGTPERQGDQVTITVQVTQPFYDVNVTILNATSEDVRCLGVDGDLSCSVGDLTPGAGAVIVVGGAPGSVGCITSGFTDPGRAITSYRTFTCR